MDGNWRQRTTRYVVVLLAIILVFTVGYFWGMHALENEPTSFLHALQVVVETFTTTGFGSDAPWSHPLMNLFVVVMDLTGVVLIFLALPVLVFPLFEEAISTTVPTSVDDLDDHVVICTLTPRGEALITELDSWGVDYVVVEPDRERAEDIYEEGYTVIHADPESIDGLEAARLRSATAIVADASDQVNTSIVLTAKEVSTEVLTVSVVDDPDYETYHRLAEADAVLSPRAALGEALATKITTGVSTDVGTIDVGDDFDIAELRIQRGSTLVGETIATSAIRERSGVNVIGTWSYGEFESPPSPDTVLERGMALLVTGRPNQLDRLRDRTVSDVRQFGSGETVVLGHGEVGRTVAEALAAEGVPHTLVDREAAADVDVVGDATDPDVLVEAGVEDARTVVLALPDDTATEFAILVVRDLNPEAELVVRAQETENVQKMYRAGADYVLALARVTGRMLASTVLDEDVLSYDQHVEVVRMDVGSLAGETIADARIRERTGCTVVAVERDGTVVTDLGPDFVFESGDDVIVAGPDTGVAEFGTLVQ
ncbi:MAG: TrkA family potassium uptake protein [Haloarculaceae archaeon]